MSQEMIDHSRFKLSTTACPTRYRARHFFNKFLPLLRVAIIRRTTDTFLFISHTTNVLLFKFRCNIFIGVRIIKEMPGSVASGTRGIFKQKYLWIVDLFSSLKISFNGQEKKYHQGFRERYLCLKYVTCYAHRNPVSSWSVVLKSFIFFVSSVNKSNFHRNPPLVITEASTFFSCKSLYPEGRHATLPCHDQNIEKSTIM